jgi:hypothetical protein
MNLLTLILECTKLEEILGGFLMLDIWGHPELAKKYLQLKTKRGQGRPKYRCGIKKILFG